MAYLDVIAEEEEKLREGKFGRLSSGWVIGSKAFQQDSKKDLAEQAGSLTRFQAVGTDGSAQREIREQVWQERLNLFAKLVSVKLDRLPAKKSAPEKVTLAAAMKLSTSVPNSWIAARLGMGKPASVSQFVRRFKLSGATQKCSFQTLLSRVKQ